jgi:hypothetical protein
MQLRRQKVRSRFEKLREIAVKQWHFGCRWFKNQTWPHLKRSVIVNFADIRVRERYAADDGGCRNNRGDRYWLENGEPRHGCS